MKALALVLLFASSAALGSDHFELRNDLGLWWSHDTTSVKVANAAVLKAGTHTFHWGGQQSCAALAHAGKITDVQMQRMLSEQTARNENQDNGFYVSLDPADSASFGECVVMVTQPKDAYIVSTYDLEKGFQAAGLALPPADANLVSTTNPLLAAAGISGRIADDWIVLFRSDALQNIVAPSGAQLLSQLSGGSDAFQDALTVDLLAQKGYAQPIPNAWTQSKQPELDKVLRGQALSATESARVYANLESDIASDPSGFNIPGNDFVWFRKSEARFKNFQSYIESQLKSATNQADQAVVDRFLDIADPLPGTVVPPQVRADWYAGRIPLPSFSPAQRRIYVFSRVDRDLKKFSEQSQQR